MTREELINFGELFLEVNKDSKNSSTYEFIDAAVKLFEQEPILDKIRAEIERKRKEVSNKNSENDESLTNYFFGLNDGLKDARDIIDKYKTRSEE